MRWIVALTTAACLMMGMAKPTRIRGVQGDRRDAVTAAVVQLSQLGHRRADRTPEALLGAFVVASAAEPPDVPRTSVDALHAQSEGLVEWERAEPRSRGPPRG